MLTRPRFKPHFHVETIAGEGIFLVSGSRKTLLKGRLYELVTPWVGTGTPEEICDRLENSASPAEVFYVLGQLEKKGFLCEANEELDAGEAALWSEQLVDPHIVVERLAASSVQVRAFGVEQEPLRRLLEAQHLHVVEEGTLGVVLTDSYLRGELKSINTEALKSGRTWLLVKPLGRQLWIGPLFRPGVTGCWECLAQRLEANSPLESYLRQKKDGQETHYVDRSCAPATLQIAWGLAANAVAGWVIRGESPLDGKIQSFDTALWQAREHHLSKLPYCKACGASAGEEGRPFHPVVLESGRKTFTSDGGHRVVSPETTLERYGHHVSPLIGAVSMLERMGKAGDDAMHVYLAGQNMARHHHTLEHVRDDLRNMSSGKGVTDLQAKASGLCEGLERYSGVFRGDEPRRRARLRDLGDAAISFNDCLLFSERQFREREIWNAKESAYNFVPLPFDPDDDIDWSPVWSLTRQAVRYLPSAFCYFSYPQEHMYCVGDSNGNAAGNTLEEAILQGFLELVERDAVALWWYNRARLPAVDLDSFGEPYLDELRTFLRGRQRDLWALDLTSDLNVPVFASFSRRGDGPQEQIIFGFGAHLDPKIALLRAVTEMNQILSYAMNIPEGKTLREHITDTETLHWLQTATLANQPYLVGDAGVPPRTAASFAHSWAADVADDVRACQALVERQGMEMLVLDQTRAEIGLPVAKVIVPGLRHFWARYAPGRLYDVPVRLGWLPRPLAEEELNPIPMFL